MIYEIKDLSFSYVEGSVILDKVNLNVRQGELLTLLGPNGSGKSTLLRLMLKLLDADDGHVLLNGKDVQDLSAKELAQSVGFVPQSEQIAFDYDVFDYVQMGVAGQLDLFQSPGPKEIEAVKASLDSLGLSYFSDRKLSQLSGGERQMVSLARAMVNKPNLILLDEPTAHLDLAKETQVLVLIEKLIDQGYSVMQTSHSPNQAFYLGGEVALLDQGGNLITGPVAEILTKERIKEVYETDIHIEYVPSLERNVASYPKKEM